jgi:hypothetical protein
MKTDFLGIRSFMAGATAEHAQDSTRKASAFGQTNQAAQPALLACLGAIGPTNRLTVAPNAVYAPA